MLPGGKERERYIKRESMADAPRGEGEREREREHRQTREVRACSKQGILVL